MSSGSLTDLDAPSERERRWPFYLAWTMGGIVVAVVLVSHLPASSLGPASGPDREPTAAPAAIQTLPPAPPRLVIPLPQGSPLRVAPQPIAPARP